MAAGVKGLFFIYLRVLDTLTRSGIYIYARVCTYLYIALIKYPGFDWVVCRTRLPSLPTRTAGIWIPIAGFEGCRIEDEAGFTYELLVGKKYQMLKPIRRVTLRVQEGDVLHVLWLMKQK
jgi:hypothetical protein